MHLRLKVPKILLTFFSLLLIFSTKCYGQHLEILQQDNPTSIRGLSIVNDSIAWASGSKGYIAVTKNGGKSWTWQQIKGFEKADLRDIEAISDKEAVVMASGTPAMILTTKDGGTNWKENYRNTDTTYFLDAMDFITNKHGFVMGDPIKGKYLLMDTKDGGDTWDNFADSPTAVPNQGAFAASGTCLRILKNGTIILATGGLLAEVDIKEPDKPWVKHKVPLLKGKPAMGVFSIAVNKNRLIAVGGDYQNDKRTDSTACYSTNSGKTWQLALTPPSGYQSCVEFIDGNTYLSTGTSSTNITTDGGKNWVKIDDASYNVCRKAKNGKLVLIAGNNGKIAKLTP